MVAAVGTPFTGLTVKVPPLQIAVADWFGITGFGLTVTVTELLPEQVYKGLV